VGNWSLYDDGALVAIDPIGETPPETLVTESTANGNIYEVASIVNAVYVAVSYPDWSYAALPYYLDPGTLGQALFGTSGGYIPDLVAHETVLYIADQGTFAEPELAGLILVDADIDSFICGPVATGLPPSSGAAVQPFGSDENQLIPTDLKLARIWPNPAQHLVRVELSLLERVGMHVSLYDLTGHMVGKKSSSEHTIVMPLNDTTGRACAPGSYILRVEAVGAVEDYSLVIRR
jgi:hypothetical protein